MIRPEISSLALGLGLLCILYALQVSASTPTLAEGQLCQERIAVLLPGLNTTYSEAPNTFEEIKSRALLPIAYDQVRYFSYDPDNPNDYTREDTFHSLSRSASALQNLIRQEINRCSAAIFDLIGHSLGGVVAFEYVANYYKGSVEATHIQHVITLDSPMNGTSRDIIVEWAERMRHPEFLASEVAAQLVLRHEENIKPRNAEIAKELSSRLSIHNIASLDDLVVPYEDAVIPGFDAFPHIL